MAAFSSKRTLQLGVPLFMCTVKPELFERDKDSNFYGFKVLGPKMTFVFVTGKPLVTPNSQEDEDERDEWVKDVNIVCAKLTNAALTEVCSFCSPLRSSFLLLTSNFLLLILLRQK